MIVVCDPQKLAEFTQQYQGQAKYMSPPSVLWDPGFGTIYLKQLLALPISALLKTQLKTILFKRCYNL